MTCPTPNPSLRPCGQPMNHDDSSRHRDSAAVEENQHSYHGVSQTAEPPPAASSGPRDHEPDAGSAAAARGGHDSGMAMAHGQATGPAYFFSAIIVGLWLAISPFAFGYGDTSGAVSDLASGAAVIGLCALSLTRKPVWAPYAASLAGIWLMFSPLVFPQKTGVDFAVDTLAGALVITLVLLMPGMPGMRMIPGPDAPPGWSYNPSTWPQRAPIIALALVGFFLSQQMAAYQLGYTGTVWEPFFRPGTAAVLTSDVSRAFPISDAGLGGVAYLIEALMGFMGDRQRWRTMPWMVTFFGILVVPLGMASITLIILQPVAVGAWCTPCLVAAVAMLVMIALTLDEVVAMGQFLFQARREGQSLWRTFWLGGAPAGASDDTLPASDRSLKGMVRGVALPWNLLASAALGIWLMASPGIFNSSGPAAGSDSILGALVVTVAAVSLSDVGRAARLVNVAFGLWFVAAPWVLAGATPAGRWNDVVAGLALLLLSLRRGPVRERYGSWQRLIR